jgi:serine protease
VAFALLGGNSLRALQAAAAAAQARYQAVVLPTRPGAAASAWQVYPNPTTGRVRVELPTGFGPRLVQVRNSVGQVLLTRPLTATNAFTDLNLTGWPTGLYLLQVSGLGGNLQRRVVVQ